jgi:hypothetical protein
MRLFFIIGLLLSIASISAAAKLFLDGPPKSSSKQAVPQNSVDMKWGEGQEAGSPDLP